MAKTKSGGKLSVKAAKKAKAAAKVEKKEKKSQNKGKGKGADEEDLESILEQIQQEWEQAHSVTEELVEGPPSRRANATLTACPSGNHLWFLGGEYFSEEGRAYFYNDVFRYSPEKDEWRNFVSPTCPGPRSAHAVATTTSGGGKLFLFGGEFSSQNQTTFYHYRDFWCFDISTHSWDRIDTKIRPSARSGHRMAVWKHYIVLFGGFYDPGVTTRYLEDLWVFDTLEYRWRQIEFKPNESRPSPRSGFSFLSTSEGILLHGGYCKEYAKGKPPVGIMLEDTWMLKMSLPDTSSQGSETSNVSAGAKSKKSGASTSTPLPSASPSSAGKGSKKNAATDILVLKWERKKRPSTAYAPALRSGCTMTLWANREMGVMFGGVTDEDTNEETLESMFWNDLNGYQWNGKGRWLSMTLRKPKTKGAGARKKGKATVEPIHQKGDNTSDSDSDDAPETPAVRAVPRAPSTVTTRRGQATGDVDEDDPALATPLPRYNAMLAVLRNTLYIYGGIFERGSREYTLDDFHSIQLDKMDRYVCLKESGIIIEEGNDESDEDDEEDTEVGDDDDDDDEDLDMDPDEFERSEAADSDEEGTVVGVGTEKDTKDDEDDSLVTDIDVEEIDESPSLRSQATAFMGVSKDITRSPEDILSTPLPGETLAMFYSRSRQYWAQKILQVESNTSSEARGKQLRTAGFNLAQDRYSECFALHPVAYY
ncbi:hypothetical protein D9757_003805 [Collybiopsis confluens]|uniref:DUF4110 domain-containing protein n=1 Tax=Collybiopsis confluens TaxID=2823264 RepID=A0A8H5HV27_9AGAR|nr:hypothetical protein D9757_003805 [Collybiopsis confluens]